MYCKGCGEILIGNEQVCPKCGESVCSDEVDVQEKLVENPTEHTDVQPQSKVALFYEKLTDMAGTVVVIAILLMLIWHIQIWPRHVYKVGCNYLEDYVLTENMDYKIQKYDKHQISDGKEKEKLDFGQGEMTYHHFYLAIPVTVHTDMIGDVDWYYKMEIFVHGYGEDGIFKKSRYVRCSGEPTWVEKVQDAFDEWEAEIQNGLDEWETEIQNNTDEYLYDPDWSEVEPMTESSAGADCYDAADPEYELAEQMAIAGRYVGMDSNDTLELCMYSSPEGNEIGIFDYCGSKGVIVYQDGQYILYGDYNMVMDVSSTANGVIQVTLWAETGGEKYSDLIMVEHY